jgi:hypothetical protein
MFKLKTKRWGEVEVYFRHWNPANGKIPFPGTLCLINKAPKRRDTGLIAIGGTNLHRLDYNSYCKETGRKMALTRALDDLLDEPKTKRQKANSKKIRAQFWNAYFFTKELARQKARERQAKLPPKEKVERPI